MNRDDPFNWDGGIDPYGDYKEDAAMTVGKITFSPSQGMFTKTMKALESTKEPSAHCANSASVDNEVARLRRVIEAQAEALDHWRRESEKDAETIRAARAVVRNLWGMWKCYSALTPDACQEFRAILADPQLEQLLGER